MPKLTPVFLLSLPRSGSTLAQRILATQPDMLTTAEPWFLLPLLSPLSPDEAGAVYDSGVARIAIDEFTSQLPLKRNDYVSAIRHFAEEVYNGFENNGAKFFLDKTPRYSLIVEQLYEVFPDAKYIYLWRNPLSIIASSIMSWGKPCQWNVHRINVDLYLGLPRLLSSYDTHKNQAVAFRYEELVSRSSEWEEMFKYVGIEWDKELLARFADVDVCGEMGDKTGITKYQLLSPKSVDRWKDVINNPLRKRWCRRYLKWLGKHQLEVMGYDLEELLEELDAVQNSYGTIGLDFLAMIYGFFYGLFELPLLKIQFQKLLRGEKTIAHR